MIISDKVLKERLITDTAKIELAEKWWEQGNWVEIGNGVLISPFDEVRLGPADYSLSVGSEYVLLRDPYHIYPLAENEQFTLGPGETALILTKEYVALPRNLTGFFVPRARRLFEGSFICASRVDPTWYGRLLIGFSNLAKFPVVLREGESFCIFYMVETSEVERPLTKREVPHLGRRSIGTLEFADLRPTPPVRPEDVTESNIRETVDSFGRPYDIVFGAIDQNRAIIFEAVERELGPKLADTAASQAVKAAFQEQQKLLRNLIIGILALIGVPIVTWVVILILRLVGQIP